MMEKRGVVVEGEGGIGLIFGERVMVSLRILW